MKVELQKIRIICHEQRLSLKDLSEKVGISQNGLQRIMKDNTTKIDTLLKIADVLNVPIKDFFSCDQAKADPPSPDLQPHPAKKYYLVIFSYNTGRTTIPQTPSIMLDFPGDLTPRECFSRATKIIMENYGANCACTITDMKQIT